MNSTKRKNFSKVFFCFRFLLKSVSFMNAFLHFFDTCRFPNVLALLNVRWQSISNRGKDGIDGLEEGDFQTNLTLDNQMTNVFFRWHFWIYFAKRLAYKKKSEVYSFSFQKCCNQADKKKGLCKAVLKKDVCGNKKRKKQTNFKLKFFFFQFGLYK